MGKDIIRAHARRDYEEGKVDGAYLRAVARACHDLSTECFDLTVAGKLRGLGDSLEAKASELDEAARNEGADAVGRWVRQIRPTLLAWLRERLSAHGAHR
ncbi:MAG: hypothetical protein IT539_17325 [Bradyrhizobiaceae bacterium]|nr:hypothetical protein [Bradyrhizobiaceae bacterium]